MLANPLSNLQKEILDFYSTDIPVDELNELKILLANFFANKAIHEADKIWDEKNFSQQEMEKWLNE